MSVKLKTEMTIWVSAKVAATLREVAEIQGVTVNGLAEDVLTRWAKMVREWAGAPEGWKAVPVTDETQAVLSEFVAELGDTETQHLETAVMMFFDQAASDKRKTRSYRGG